MARHFTRRIHGQNREVRESVWFGFTPAETTLAAADTATLVFVLNTAALALRPFTVVRTRGMWGLRSDQQAASENYSASMAMSVVSEQASAIGVTAIPTPETDRGSDLFFVYESAAGALGFDVDGSLERGKWREFDSKAMRKVDISQDIVWSVETSSISSGVITHLSARMLVKLH